MFGKKRNDEQKQHPGLVQPKSGRRTRICSGSECPSRFARSACSGEPRTIAEDWRAGRGDFRSDKGPSLFVVNKREIHDDSLRKFRDCPRKGLQLETGESGNSPLYSHESIDQLNPLIPYNAQEKQAERPTCRSRSSTAGDPSKTRESKKSDRRR